MKIKEITEYFDRIAPTSLSAEWDNDGVMLLCDKDIKKAVLTLDVNTPAVEFAIKEKADLIISHHPFIFRPISRIYDDALSNNIKKLIKNDISVLSYHTRIDAADAGINQYISQKLGFKDIVPFGLDENDKTGRIGVLNFPVDITDLCRKVKDFFGCCSLNYSDFGGNIQKVAVVSGGGSEYAQSAKNHGADVFISGEFKHHQYINFMETSFPVISVDHYHCENIFVDLMYDILKEAFPSLEILKNKATPPFLTMC